MLRYILSDIPAVTLDLSLDKPEISSKTTDLLSGIAQYFINNGKSESVETTNKMQPYNLLFQSFLKAQHVSSGPPLIIRSTKLYLQPLVYIHMW